MKAKLCCGLAIFLTVGIVNAKPYAKWDRKTVEMYGEQAGFNPDASMPRKDQVPVPAYPDAHMTLPPMEDEQGGLCTMGLALNGSWKDIKKFYAGAVGDQYEMLDAEYVINLTKKSNSDAKITIIRDTDRPEYDSMAMITFQPQQGYECPTP